MRFQRPPWRWRRSEDSAVGNPTPNFRLPRDEAPQLVYERWDRQNAKERCRDQQANEHDGDPRATLEPPMFQPLDRRIERAHQKEGYHHDEQDR
jgi:hypothetical protein